MLALNHLRPFDPNERLILVEVVQLEDPVTITGFVDDVATLADMLFGEEAPPLTLRLAARSVSGHLSRVCFVWDAPRFAGLVQASEFAALRLRSRIRRVESHVLRPTKYDPRVQEQPKIRGPNHSKSLAGLEPSERKALKPDDIVCSLHDEIFVKHGHSSEFAAQAGPLLGAFEKHTSFSLMAAGEALSGAPDRFIHIWRVGSLSNVPLAMVKLMDLPGYAEIQNLIAGEDQQLYLRPRADLFP